jgi:methionyl-tRNA formyltransferase
VVFLGTPEFAVPTLDRLLASRHTVVGVVTQPDRPRGRGQKPTFAPVKARALEAGVPVLQPASLKTDDALAALRALDADLGVVAAYGKILTEAVLAIPRLGMINVHASLLPRYRGAAPIHRAVMAGEPETGVTIMRVVKALDAGAMLATVKQPIGPDDTSEEIERRLADQGAALLLDIVDRLSEGAVEEVPQNDAEATYAHRISKDDATIDWSRSAETIHNQVRGLHPWPHAETFASGQRLILHRASWSDESAGQAPGTIIVADGDTLAIATGRGRLLVQLIQAEGKRPMTPREFLAGRRLPAGLPLSPRV